jgi:hypothetical protein
MTTPYLSRWRAPTDRANAPPLEKLVRQKTLAVNSVQVLFGTILLTAVDADQDGLWDALLLDPTLEPTGKIVHSLAISAKNCRIRASRAIARREKDCNHPPFPQTHALDLQVTYGCHQRALGIDRKVAHHHYNGQTVRKHDAFLKLPNMLTGWQGAQPAVILESSAWRLAIIAKYLRVSRI